MVKRKWCSNHRFIFLSRINVPAKRFGHTLTNQGQSALIPSSSLELFFLALIGSHKAESTQPAAKKDLSSVLSYGHYTWKIFNEEHAATSHTQRRTSPAASHTSYTHLQTQGSIHYPATPKKNLFSLWFVYLCDNKLFAVVFQRSFVIYLYCQLIYSVMETNH